MKLSRIVFGGIALVLVLACLLQTVTMRNVQRGDVTSATRPIGLATKVPQVLEGWTVADEPLGPTEGTSTAAERTLNYDDMVNRRYRRGGDSVGVYVAYWSPGRMPMEKVASHTPDRCWSENGWTCDQMRFPEDVAAPSGPLRPAYWRLFTPPGNGTKQYVMYWHLVGDELYDYGGGFNRRPSAIKWWRDMLHYAFAGSREQYFIRLTSDRPFEELRGDPGFEQVLEALARLGLAAR
jgi:hypothetical protein